MILQLVRKREYFFSCQLMLIYLLRRELLNKALKIKRKILGYLTGFPFQSWLDGISLPAGTTELAATTQPRSRTAPS